MNQRELSLDNQEFDPLTDSLASRVRWRVSDYAAIFRAEIDLMLAAEEAAVRGGASAASPQARP
jgi:hypothetical protein